MIQLPCGSLKIHVDDVVQIMVLQINELILASVYNYADNDGVIADDIDPLHDDWIFCGYRGDGIDCNQLVHSYFRVAILNFHQHPRGTCVVIRKKLWNFKLPI